MAELLHPLVLEIRRRVARQHAEAGLEGRDLALAIVGGDVVHCDPAVAPQPFGNELRDPAVRPVAGLEVQDRGPVVG